jgi:hypothetical protein
VTGLVVVAFAIPASAQNIRTYGDDSSQSGGSGGGGGSQSQSGGQMVYPGQPMPEQSSSNSGTSQKKSSKSKEEEGSSASYEIKIHDPTAKQGGEESTDSGSEAVEQKPKSDGYRGIVPGERDEVDHLKEQRESGSSTSNPNKLTWLGFQPKDDKTRVFIQTARSPDYNVSESDGGRRMVVTLENTELSDRNFQRSIDTSFFDRNITSIDARPGSGNTVDVTIELESSESPSVETSEDYLYIDFPHSESDGDSSGGGQG